MSAHSSSLARWTDEEHQILVQLTNDQIELESNDHTQEISWAAHWRKVSVQLQAAGYNRTNTACQSYWKRVAEIQKANEEAAGPRWDDQEHQILLGMTEDQLALEKEDHSAVIPWPKHWKKVSLRLQENGYHRTPNACAAYWLKVGYDFSVDNYESQPGTPKFREDVDVELVSEDEDEKEVGLDDVGEDEMEVEKEDEDARKSEPRQVKADHSASKAPQKEQPHPEDLLEPKNILLSNAASMFTPSITPAPSEKDPSDDESYQPQQRAPTRSKVAQMPTKVESTPPRVRSPKVPLRRGFRFTAEQRAILEAEAAKFGTYPGAERTKEMARDLGVKEKTIRNWFVHRRSHKGQVILSNMATPGPNCYDESFVDESSPASAPAQSEAKRMSSVDRKEGHSPAGNDRETRPSKRLRVGNYDNEMHEVPQREPPIAPTNPITAGGDLRTQQGSANRPMFGIPSSKERSQTSSEAGPPAAQDSATTIRNPFYSNDPAFVKNFIPQRGGDRRPIPPVNPEDRRQEFKKSPSVPTPVPGADWNLVNSTTVGGFQSVNSTRAVSTPAPNFHALPSNGPLLNHHPYINPVSATPPPHHTFQQPASASLIPQSSTSLNEKDEKEWISSKASRIQTEIENLQNENTARIQKLGSIDQRINEITNEENTIEEMKEKEIHLAIQEIEERYRGRNEQVKAQQQDLARLKDVELAGLHKNVADLKKKTTALKLVQDLVNLYEEE